MKFNKTISTPESKWFFTSDLHLSHANILRFSGRPFKDVLAMNARFIENINSCVRETDVLVIAGDFSWDNPGRHFDRINCKNIHFVLGSHDKHIKSGVHPSIKSVQDVLYIELDGQQIVVSHCPFLRWERSHYGSWNLFGHLHTRVHPVGIPSAVGIPPGGVWSRFVNLLKARREQPVQPQDTDFNRIIRTGKMVDIGVDGHLYLPWSFYELKQFMEYKRGYLVHNGKSPGNKQGAQNEKE